LEIIGNYWKLLEIIGNYWKLLEMEMEIGNWKLETKPPCDVNLRQSTLQVLYPNEPIQE
jgi:hypothetical protein